MFIDFPENFPTARLFCPAHLMFFFRIFPPARLFCPTRLFGTLEYLNIIQLVLPSYCSNYNSLGLPGAFRFCLAIFACVQEVIVLYWWELIL